jgi:hypothetical protein
LPSGDVSPVLLDAALCLPIIGVSAGGGTENLLGTGPVLPRQGQFAWTGFLGAKPGAKKKAGD